VLVAVLVFHLLQIVGDEASWLTALEACLCGPPYVLLVLMQPLELPGQQRRSSSPSTSNSSSGKDIKEDREYIQEDGLALDLAHEPPMRAKTMGVSRALKMGCRTMIHLS
jgi:hypothetical protein